jgi:hypothetical protein
VAVDSAGNIYVADQGGNTIRKGHPAIAPVANAGPDQKVECTGGRTEVLLDGRSSSDVDDVVLGFAWFEGGTLLGTNAAQYVQLPLATHTITLEVSDASGDTAQATVIVRVVDTTPPDLQCPQDFAVEFTGATGAVVSFAVSAADACSAVTLNCAPAPGSTFSIGSTAVQCIALDEAGNRSVCSFNLTVFGPRSVKQRVLAELTALRDGLAGQPDTNRLDQAVGRLTDSLDPALWLDETHLTPKDGDRVFQGEKDAVVMLQELAQDPSALIGPGALQGFNMRLLKVDRLLALISVDEAAAAGATPQKIAEDRSELAKGDEDAAAGRVANAIEHYRNAWKHAVHLQINGVVRVGAAALRLQCIALPGKALEFQASTNLTDWTILGTATADTNGVLQFEDPAPGSSPAKYYRVTSP